MEKNVKPSLAKVNSALARQWHPTKNAPLTPGGVTPGSSKKVWWLCTKGHEWKAAIYNRSKGIGCPHCSGRYATAENNLKTVNPELAKEWHPIKNTPLTPKDVTSCSGAKVWWLCKNGHEWEAAISSRDRNGCPYCSGRRVAKDNCLQVVNPRLAREWRPAKNTPLTPKDVTESYSRKVWWICRKGHKWEAFIRERMTGQGCPFCSGHRVCKDNCLQTVKPGLARQWHPTKNMPLTPKDVTPGSDIKVWWICNKGHEWEARIANRAKAQGCPYCSGRRVCKDNCLQTVNPMLACEWHPTKNAALTTRDVTPGSNRKVWWMCSKGHEWEAKIASRAYGKGCPFCSGRRPAKENSLEAKGPWLVREWHPTKNVTFTPKDVAPFSERQIWWKCRKGHEQRERIIDRYRRGGCTICTLKARVPRLFETA